MYDNASIATRDLTCYSKRIEDAIENILSTPRKKEIIDEKDNG